jgi:hypothetical protein
MQNRPENFKLMDEGDVNKFPTRLDDITFEFVSTFSRRPNSLFLGLSNNQFSTNANSSSTPVVKGLLHRDLSGKPCKYSWKYYSAMGMLSYLQNTSCPEISMATHQTACFSNNLMLSHKKLIMRIGHYILDMHKRGIMYKPDKTKGLECYVDADFAGSWSQADANNANNVLSWTGFFAKLPYFIG